MDTFTAMNWRYDNFYGADRSFIDFDLSAWPPTAQLHKATLRLFAELTPSEERTGHLHNGASNELLVRRVTFPWAEDTITWNNQPSTASGDQIELPRSKTRDQTYEIDVTSFVHERLADPAHNFGIAIQLKTEEPYRAVYFASSDHANAGLHPQLELLYSQPASEP